ncbi:DNA (cytosine-5-)-methyltransferase [Rossellomorea sp. GAMAL-10_SWC]
MLKLGTVFSGIGAIEHSLKRLGIDFECAFACDNGGVDIFSKKVERNVYSIDIVIESLQRRVDEVLHENFNDDYTLTLNEHLQHIQELNTSLKDFSKVVGLEIKRNEFLHHSIYAFFNMVREMDKTQIKMVPTLFRDLLSESLEEVPVQHYFYLVKDFKDYYKKYNNNEDLITRIKMSYVEYELIFETFIRDNNIRELNSMLSEIVDMVNMLHERISTMEILRDLSSIPNYEKKKEYVDNLYNHKLKSNFVMSSFKENYKIEDNHFHWNASFLDGTQYRDNIDLFVGGSPCQSFSLVGKRRGLQDTRGTLFYEYARLISEIQPKVFIYENVKGLLGHEGGNTWATMQQVFDDLNYEWEYEVLNAKNYGIPQNRERLFVVGFRKDLVLKEKFEFPKSKPLEKIMKDFLLDNVSGKYYLNKKGVDFVTKEKNIMKRYTQIDGDIQLCQKANQQFNWHGDFVFVDENKDREKMMEDLEKYFLSEKVKKYVMASGTKNFYSKPKIDLEIARPLLTTMHKMHRAGVDNYVTTEGRIRKLTPRECLRLMGFCDSFRIVVSDTQLYQQAGNSIVVDVLMSIFEKIAASLPQIIEGDGYEFKECVENESDRVKETNVKRQEQLFFL